MHFSSTIGLALGAAGIVDAAPVQIRQISQGGGTGTTGMSTGGNGGPYDVPFHLASDVLNGFGFGGSGRASRAGSGAIVVSKRDDDRVFNTYGLRTRQSSSGGQFSNDQEFNRQNSPQGNSGFGRQGGQFGSSSAFGQSEQSGRGQNSGSLGSSGFGSAQGGQQGFQDFQDHGGSQRGSSGFGGSRGSSFSQSASQAGQQGGFSGGRQGRQGSQQGSSDFDEGEGSFGQQDGQQACSGEEGSSQGQFGSSRCGGSSSGRFGNSQQFDNGNEQSQQNTQAENSK